jgi:hypothetical protein
MIGYAEIKNSVSVARSFLFEAQNYSEVVRTA